jgi:hypothetical protein
MSTQPLTASAREDINPFEPPVSRGEDPWNFGDPVAVAIRREHQKDEAYLKAMGILNYFYAFFFGALFAADARYPIYHAMRQIDAPWSVQPRWIVANVLSFVLTIVAIFAGVGFRRLACWAFRFEAVLALCWLMLWFVASFFFRPTPRPFSETLAFLFLYLALAAPMMNLLDFRSSPVLDPGYKAIVNATPHIRLRAKMPLEPKLMSGLMLGCALVAFYFSKTS